MMKKFLFSFMFSSVYYYDKKLFLRISSPEPIFPAGASFCYKVERLHGISPFMVLFIQISFFYLYSLFFFFPKRAGRFFLFFRFSDFGPFLAKLSRRNAKKFGKPFNSVFAGGIKGRYGGYDQFAVSLQCGYKVIHS